MSIRLACTVLLMVACADPTTTSERDEALTCDVGPPGSLGNACAKASSPQSIDASPLDSNDAVRIHANDGAYGVRLAPVNGLNEGKVVFTVPRTGTYHIYLGTPNLPVRIVRFGETLAPSCSSYIASTECSFLRRVMTFTLRETETIQILFDPTDRSYVRLYIQSEIPTPRTCSADELVEEELACAAANEGAQTVTAAPLLRQTSTAPALALDGVYGVKLPSVATVSGTTTYGGIVRFQPPADGDYELYLGTPNLPLRIITDDPAWEPAPMVCSRYIPSTECNLLRRGTRLTLRDDFEYFLEIGPGANTYIRMSIRQLVGDPSAVKLGTPAAYPSPNATIYLAPGDLNGDGAVDLVASAPDDASGANVIMIHRNIDNGAFDDVSPMPTSAPGEAVVSDFNGDGVQDIAAVSFDGQGPLPGTYFQNIAGYEYDYLPWGNGRDFGRWLDASDFDGDGIEDLVAAWADWQTEPGIGGGFVIVKMPERVEIDSEVAFGRGTIEAVAGDFNGDGFQDVVAASRHVGTLQLYLGDGSGKVTFASEATLPDGTTQLGVFDLNGDGRSDLVQLGASQTASIVYGQTIGLSAPQTLSETFTAGIAAGDFDHDGRLDLALGEFLSIGIYLATDAGFVKAETFEVPNKGLTLVSEDFNGDGFDDLAAPTFDSVTVWLSTP